ncbi:MAG: hypothetical protein ACKO0N_14495, partial [Planctomycetota bacterium]
MIDRTIRTKHIFLADSPEQTIPVVLQKINQWLVWKAGPFKANGKFDKFPYGKDGTGRTWQKSHQWMDFEVATKKAQLGLYAGIGLVLPAITLDGLHLVAL